MRWFSDTSANPLLVRGDSTRLVPQHETMLLLCQREGILRDLESARCSHSVAICRKKFLNEAPLLRDTSFQLNNVPPEQLLSHCCYKPVHVNPKMHKPSAYRLKHACAEPWVNRTGC